jgi:NAD(P)-dependent dehydrogenase (short-subunit alcohol dehydrogenase family)
MLPLDVRSDESVQTCIQTVLAQAGRLDVLVNNAGYSQGGAIEENTIADMQALFETNFFGAMRMINAVLPIMRQQRQGHIINTSSILGLVAVPFVGIYAATKFALEGATEALRAEVAPFNIAVSMVEPGTIKTNFVSNPPAHPLGVYQNAKQSVMGFIRKGIENGPEPDTVAKVIVEIAETAHPRLRYVIGGRIRMLAGFKGILPESAFDRVRSRVFRIPAAASTAISQPAIKTQ